LRFSGRYLACDQDAQLVVAEQGVLRCRGVEIAAGSLQYSIDQGVLRAQRGVELRRGARKLSGETLSLQVETMTGYLLLPMGADGQTATLLIEGDKLETKTPDEPPAAEEFQPLPYDSTGTWVVARRLVITPGEKIRFDRASIYVNEKRAFALPYLVQELGSGEGPIQQMLSMSSNGGINLDLPIYYQMQDNRIGRLHLRRSSGESYWGAPGATGFSLGLDEQYSLPGGQGTLALDDLTRSTRGMRWAHRQEFGLGANADFLLNYYHYDPSQPAVATAHASFRKQLGACDLSFISQASSFGGRHHWSTEATTYWRSLKLGRTSLAYDLGAKIGIGAAPYQVEYAGGRVLYRSADSQALHQGLVFSLRPPVWQVSRKASLTANLNSSFTRYSTGANRGNVDARVTLRRGLGRLGSATVAYSWSQHHGDYYLPLGKRRVDATVFLRRGQSWYGSLFASFDLGRGGRYGSFQFSRLLPWSGSQWRLDMDAAFTRFEGFGYTDSRISLVRRLGNYELLLSFSPTGRSYYQSAGYYSLGYGLRPIGSRSIWLELAPSRF